MFSSSHIFLKSGCSCFTLVSTPALSAFAGILTSPTDWPFFNCLMALLISSFVGVQHLIGRSLVADRISGGFTGAGLLSSSWKCSIHLYFCPSSSGITPPFLSLTGLSGLANFPAKLSVMGFRSLVLF
ncbi:hypothetical protein DPMN_070441 [Dreissena polymorpha]|uniref:Uncharacterized protein n=1 Tax=Dreissena polymorpha TaxID=45954 RepID=A0A9D4BX72_DREPO|nr:hypothetical protein DPMN_070441 [Dreissena polymorpha]